MKFYIFLSIILVATTMPAAARPQGQKPLTKDEVLGLVKFDMDSAALAQRIRERGVDFEPTEDYVQALKSAGAQDVVVQAVIRTSPLGQKSGPPLTKDQIVRLVKLGMDGAEVAKRIKGRGVDFEPTDADLDALRTTGAPEAVTQAIRQVKPRPLTREQIGKLVAGGVASERAAALVKQRGINFVPDEQYLDMLCTAGADDSLITAVREAGQAVPAELVVATSPGAEVYLDGALQGRAGSQGELRVQAKPGEHTLKVSLKGMLDFQRTVTLTSPEAPRLDAHLESRPPEEQPSEEARQAEAAVTEARAKLQQAEATLELNKATYERDENLFRAGLMTAQERDAAEQAYHGSQANVRALQDQVRVAEAQLAVAQANGKNVRVNPKDGLKYVWIPPGTFMMGCSPGDNVCSDKEKPAHQVAITRGFWMGQTPVTVGAYKRFARAAGRSMPEAPRFNMDWANENMPIVNLTWDDAHAYCEWMGGRLPTEAEWEYAARGGSTEARYGNLDEIAWYDRNSGNQTHDVGQKRANGFGLYDVLGNVWEWVNDWYDENYYQRSPSQDPQGPSGGQFRVLRGGSWNISASGDVRVSYRVWGNPTVRVSGGFRCSGEVGSP